MKYNIRNKYKTIRSSLSYVERQRAENIINKALFKFLVKQKEILSVAGYYPIQSELNILTFLSQLNILGYQTSLPVTNNNENKLYFVEWKTSDAIDMNYKAKLLVWEPINKEKLIVPNLIITPLLAFDRQLNRLGYGCGFYDRTFINYNNSLRVGCAFACQETEYIPVEESDVQLHVIITEKEIIYNQQKFQATFK